MIDSAEPTITCPYDRSHSILRSRMQMHLTGCRAQNPNMEKATCPYNSTHVFNIVEMNYHKEHCVDKKIVDSFVYKVGDNDPPKGIQPVMNFGENNRQDDWETDNTSFSVLDNVKNGIHEKSVLVPLIGAPKSERKAHRLNERLRYQHVVSGDPQLNKCSSSQQQIFRAEDKPARKEDKALKDEKLEQTLPNQPPPAAVKVGERVVNTDFPTLSEMMPALNVSEGNEAQSVAPPSAWGKPMVRQQEEKIAWPTASARAPTSVGFGASASGRNAFEQPAARPAMPARAPSNPWATNMQRSDPSGHLASAPPPNVAPPVASSNNPNPTVGRIWGRGKVFSNAQARMTSEDFPTLLPVSSRGRKQRP